MFLNTVSEGDTVKVINLNGGTRFYNRLASMGISRDCIITVKKNPGYGPLVVECSGKRFGMGRGMAEKLTVAVVPESNS